MVTMVTMVTIVTKMKMSRADLNGQFLNATGGDKRFLSKFTNPRWVISRATPLSPSRPK